MAIDALSAGQIGTYPRTGDLAVETRLRTVRRHGSFALAYSAAFQTDMAHFGDERGFLAYKKVGRTAFVLADPVAPLADCRSLIRRFVREAGDVCFWQSSRPVAEILEGLGFRVNQMGIETRIALDGYTFDGPRKRNFRTAVNRVNDGGILLDERSASFLDRRELRAVGSPGTELEFAL